LSTSSSPAVRTRPSKRPRQGQRRVAHRLDFFPPHRAAGVPPAAPLPLVKEKAALLSGARLRRSLSLTNRDSTRYHSGTRRCNPPLPLRAIIEKRNPHNADCVTSVPVRKTTPCGAICVTEPRQAPSKRWRGSCLGIGSRSSGLLTRLCPLQF